MFSEKFRNGERREARTERVLFSIYRRKEGFEAWLGK
jgi:hypothetical protein